MVCKGFRFQVLLRLCLLMGTMAGMLLVLYRTDWYITAFCLLLIMGFQVFGLLHFVERTNRDISSFLEAIRYADFTQRFSRGSANKSFDSLYSSFNHVQEAFQKLKAEKQADHLYLQALVEHVGIGLLSFDETGEVYLANKVTKELLHVPHLHNIQALGRVSTDLVQALERIGNNGKALVTVQPKHEELLLTLHATELTSQGRKLKIVSLQNIKSELEEQELQTWQKVIRVLTHEIMNSVTPVISLTSTVAGLLNSGVISKHRAGEPLEEEALEDMQAGLKTIEKRSTGMLHFVRNYRRLMRLPAPDLQPVAIADLLYNVHTLLGPELEAQKVKVGLYLPQERVMVYGDAEQLEQVIINLLKNAMEACQRCNEASIEVEAYQEGLGKDRLRIDITDNGQGMEEEVLDKIFIPFYTTKKQGSGIGLSLSKQIMQQHGGSIRVRSGPGGPTTFSLLLRTVPLGQST